MQLLITKARLITDRQSLEAGDNRFVVAGEFGNDRVMWPLK